jgi:glycosyltransferase involved in cell wall biosynthesis
MHIGLIIYGTLDTVSGGYLYDRKLVEHMRENGDTVDIISQPWQYYFRHLTHNLDHSLLKDLVNTRYDVLLQDELNHPSLFLLNRKLKQAQKSQNTKAYPLVSIVHHLRVSENHPRLIKPIYSIVEKAYLNTVDGFIFNSYTTQKQVNSLSSQTIGKPHVVAYPAGDRFNILNGVKKIEQSNVLRILFVGNVDRRKGLHVLLKALTMVNCSWRLSIVGSFNTNYAYAKDLCRFTIENHINENISWLGRINDNDLKNAYANNDVFVLPSQYEGFGIVYLEAMGFGLPVIATTSGGAHEIVHDGINGYLIPPEDTKSLADKISLLAQNPVLRQNLAISARQSFQSHPHWHDSTAKIRSFLQEISQSA